MAAVAAASRADELVALRDSVSNCTACRLAATRTQVVFGSGDPAAELMFVGEAPGFHEDQQGIPFVGAAGKLLEKLLGEIGLARDDVFIGNVLKCRPPGNRDPLADEIEACRHHLFRQIELIQPRVVATLGNFATKLLSGSPAGITRVHGREQSVRLGPSQVLLFPIYHPAAALYTQAMLGVLEEDFRRLPELLSREPAPTASVEGAGVDVAAAEPIPNEPATQLGLFSTQDRHSNPIRRRQVRFDRGTVRPRHAPVPGAGTWPKRAATAFLQRFLE